VQTFTITQMPRCVLVSQRQFFAEFCNTITRQQIELECFSNILRIGEVF